MKIRYGDGDEHDLTPPDWKIEYDTEAGVLREHIDGAVNAEIAIRAGLIEQLTRQAVLAELGRLGYTVLPPNTDTPEGGDT